MKLLSLQFYLVSDVLMESLEVVVKLVSWICCRTLAVNNRQPKAQFTASDKLPTFAPVL